MWPLHWSGISWHRWMPLLSQNARELWGNRQSISLYISSPFLLAGKGKYSLGLVGVEWWCVHLLFAALKFRFTQPAFSEYKILTDGSSHVVEVIQHLFWSLSLISKMTFYLRSKWLSGEAGTTLRFMWWISTIQLHCTANAAASWRCIPLHRDKIAALSHINIQHRPCKPFSNYFSLSPY